MPAIRLVPDADEMARMLRKGLTDGQIAEKYGVSRSTVSAAIQRYKLRPKAPRYNDYIPWTVRSEDQMHYFARMLRLKARTDLGDEINPRDAQKLRSFLNELARLDAVVCYDPEVEGGFYLDSRRDGEKLIRP